MHLAARSTCNLGLVSYEEGLRIQREYEAARLDAAIGDTLLLCEHPPVFTLGTNADADHVLADHAELVQRGIELHRTDRGGEVTWHGPGQQVCYVIADLRRRGRDTHRFCRDL